MPSKITTSPPVQVERLLSFGRFHRIINHALPWLMPIKPCHAFRPVKGFSFRPIFQHFVLLLLSFLYFFLGRLRIRMACYDPAPANLLKFVFLWVTGNHLVRGAGCIGAGIPTMSVWKLSGPGYVMGVFVLKNSCTRSILYRSVEYVSCGCGYSRVCKHCTRNATPTVKPSLCQRLHHR